MNVSKEGLASVHIYTQMDSQRSCAHPKLTEAMEARAVTAHQFCRQRRQLRHLGARKPAGRLDIAAGGQFLDLPSALGKVN
jgi:hypothetical protein